MRWILFVGIGVGLCGSLGCKRQIDLEALKQAEVQAQSAESAAGLREDDKLCEEAIRKGEVAEALEWLDNKHTNHVSWKGSKSEWRGFAQKMYDAGATKVYAHFDRIEKSEVTAIYIIVLPKDAGKRKKLFAAYNKFWDDEDIRSRDVGQKYIWVNND